MRQIAAIATLCLFVLGTMPGAALANNPHFISAGVGPNVAANGNLKCTFKIAGLGDNVTITVTCSANGTATYGCENNGGNFPNADNKQGVSGPTSASGQFTSGQNGQVSGSLTLNPPTSGLTLVCPGGQTRVLCAVSYTNVTLSGGGDTANVAGTFSRTFFPNCLL